MSDEPKVWTFFYGSFMNMDVLAQVDYVPEQVEVARLGGYDIEIRPLANLVTSNRHSVYGVAATATHGELARLYAQDWLDTYLPYPVVVETQEGTTRPAFCYIVAAMDEKPAANDYIDRILTPARQHGFPDWYIERLESFRP